MKLVFIDGTPGFDPERISKKPTGGILSSLTILPQLMVKRGHEVWVKSTFNEGRVLNGVNYMAMTDTVLNADVIIFNRNVISRDLVAQAKAAGAKTLWWLHDVVDHRYLIDDACQHVDGIIALSDYCKRTYSSFYGLDDKKFTVIPNGVDKEVFSRGDYSKRNPHLIIYASAPIKGMKPLGFLATNFKRMDPKNELRMYASQSLHDKNDDSLIKYQLQMAVDQGAVVMDPIPQEQLAAVMKEAWLLLMPNSYPEICSNLLLQAKATGLPVVASPTGSIPEFLQKGGVVTKSNPCDLYFWWKEFAEEALKLTVDKERHQKLSNEAADDVADWDEIANKWDSYLRGIK